MKLNTTNINNYQPTILDVYTPELGVFTITGDYQDVLPVESLYARLYRTKRVNTSTFERIVFGRPRRRLAFF